MYVFNIIGVLTPQLWTIKWNGFLVMSYEIYTHILIFLTHFKVTVNCNIIVILRNKSWCFLIMKKPPEVNLRS